jgi:antitoxin component of MazEF toxin-antitoxin module
MITTIMKIGNSQGVTIAELMDLAGLKVGDQVDVTVHESEAIVLTLARKVIEKKEAAKGAKRLSRKNAELFRRPIVTGRRLVW